MKRKGVLRLISGAVLLLTGCGGGTLANLPARLDPASITMQAGGQQQQFTPKIDGKVYSKDVKWWVNGIEGGNATVGFIVKTGATGLYTTPKNAPNPNKVKITVSQAETNANGNDVFASVSSTVTITGSGAPPSASIDVSPSTITSGEEATLAWSSANVDSCTIKDDTGNTIASGTQGSIQVSPSETTSYDLECTGSNGSASDTAKLTVQPLGGKITVSISPTSGVLESGKTLKFSAVVTNDDSNSGVTWSATFGSNPAATDKFHATYTAPTVDANTNVTITAKSVADPSVSASATITVTPAGSGGGGGGDGSEQIGMDPMTANVKLGESKDFAATVTGDDVTDTSCMFSLAPAQGDEDPTNLGSLDPTGPTTVRYTAPTSIKGSLTTVLVVVTSKQFPNLTTWATVSVGK